MDLNTELLQIIGNGSIAVIVFVIWFLSFKQFNRQHEKIHKQNNENVERLFALMDSEREQKEALTRVLTSLELKLDIFLRNKYDSK